MKIAHIAPPWFSIPPKNYGGTEIVLYNLIEEQVAQGHDVTLLAPGDARTSARLVSFFSRSLIDSGIPWQAHLKAFYHLYKAVEYVERGDFDIVHGHLSSSADMYLFPLISRFSTPLLVTLHSRFPFDRVQSWTGDADAHYLEWLSTVPMVAISDSARDEVPYPLNFVGVVHHGLPMQLFHASEAQPADFVVWLGRIVSEKGTHLAIEAARRAGVPLVIAGTVDPHLSEAVDYFEQMVKPHVDGQQVNYIGPVNMRQKIDLLSRARALLNPLQWEEPFGMVMIEAMALGCPVISFARGAAPEIVADQASGFLVDTVDAMADALSRVDTLDRRVVREHAERNFSARAMAEKYIHLYRKVIASALLEVALPEISAPHSRQLNLSPPVCTPVHPAHGPASGPHLSSLGARATVEAEPQSPL